MLIEVKVPALPESVADATIAAWHKKVGDKVTRDENILDLETDKVVLEVPAPADGVLQEILFQVGDVVTPAQILARIGEQDTSNTKTSTSKSASSDVATSPAVRRVLSEHDLTQDNIIGTGKEGRLTKEDVIAFIESNRKKESEVSSVKSSSDSLDKLVETNSNRGLREERRVPMTRLRAKIAERLVQSQQTAAMLTTFNEVNLNAVMALRAQYKDSFEKKHGVRLGLMSFFTRAVVDALKRFPMVNASIDGQDIVYHGYFDIGIAVSTERGLVVPVLRDANQLGMADIEKTIHDFAGRARDGKLAMEEMQGGTFTITNGGVFRSLLATPIINPPQAGILGMHKIEERPVVDRKS